jgi:23S rRNA pseudouridine1911/1915/1917 synthase
MVNMEILLKNKSVIAINKPKGIPSESDPTGDKDAMTLTAEELSALSERDSLWLVHRLDRVVGGILLFARDKDSAAALSRQFSEHSAVKEYLAVVEGEAPGGELCDFIYKDSRLSKAFIVDRKRNGVKEARLQYTPIQRIENEKGVYTLVRVNLLTGRFHQIRAQLASRGTPLVGDGKYGSRDKGAKMPSLFAFHLGFTLRSQTYDIYKYPSHEEYPWCLFDKSNFQ